MRYQGEKSAPSSAYKPAPAWGIPTHATRRRHTVFTARPGCLSMFGLKAESRACQAVQQF